MCFIIDPRTKKIKVAKKNITCYKIVDLVFGSKTECSSWWTHHIYTMGIENKKINLKINKHGQINRGYHSYIINKDEYCNAIFIIPKGTRYYLSSLDNEYVSETIIFKCFIK